LIERRVVEHGVQRAAANGLTLLNGFERAAHARQRKIEAGSVTVRTTSIERDHAPTDIDDRRARRATGGARRGLEVKRVEVVVLADAVLGSVTVEPRQGPSENRKLLTRVVTHHADLASDLRALRI